MTSTQLARSLPLTPAPPPPSADDIALWQAALRTGTTLRCDPRTLAAAKSDGPADPLGPPDLLQCDPFQLSTRELGTYGETVTAHLLTHCGWRVLERNIRLRGGEIDLMAQDAGTLVHLEVKTRRTTLTGTPQAAVTPAKARRLRRLVGENLLRSEHWHDDVRIDVAALCVLPDGTIAYEHLRSAV